MRNLPRFSDKKNQRADTGSFPFNCLTYIEDVLSRSANHLLIGILPALFIISVASFLNSSARAQESAEIYDVLQSAQEALDEVIQQVTDGEFELPYQLVSPEEFEQALSDFQNVMNDGNLEAMARWFPSATEIMAYVDLTPGLEPYADWLRQRLDYAAVANEAVSTIALTQPQTETAPSPQQPKLTTPAPEQPKMTKPAPEQPEQAKVAPPQPDAKPAESEPAKTTANQRVAFARSEDTWSKKLAGRPAIEGAEKLVPPLKKIFTSEGVPAELVWIAEVESTFNPAARSPAGAVGLFQLMPATASHLGLEIEPEDQRLDPARNGRAAAKYLKALHNRFEDWPLAIAAYNGGEGRVAKLLKANGGSNLDAISDNLPSQTQMYVPKVLATIRHREGFDPTSRW